MKIKTFIFRTPYNIQGLEPLRKEVNKFGVTENFYLINNSNLETLLINRYDKDFKERTIEDITWFLNSNNVSIVNTVSLLDRFIKRDYFSVMNCSSRVSVLS